MPHSTLLFSLFSDARRRPHAPTLLIISLRRLGTCVHASTTLAWCSANKACDFTEVKSAAGDQPLPLCVCWIRLCCSWLWTRRSKVRDRPWDTDSVSGEAAQVQWSFWSETVGDCDCEAQVEPRETGSDCSCELCTAHMLHGDYFTDHYIERGNKTCSFVARKKTGSTCWASTAVGNKMFQIWTFFCTKDVRDCTSTWNESLGHVCLIISLKWQQEESGRQMIGGCWASWFQF